MLGSGRGLAPCSLLDSGGVKKPLIALMIGERDDRRVEAPAKVEKERKV